MKLVLYMAQTANGMIARSNGETPRSDVEWKCFTQTAQQYPALVMGAKTYRIMTTSKELERINPPLTIVLSRKRSTPPQQENTLLAHSPRDAIQLLTQRNITHALLVGGAKANASFLKERLIREIILDFEPFLFGNGVPLFTEELLEAKLRLLSFKKIGADTIQLHYTVISP